VPGDEGTRSLRKSLETVITFSKIDAAVASLCASGELSDSTGLGTGVLGAGELAESEARSFN
jgi:hypothetical protein